MSDHSKDWVGQTLSGGRYRVDAKLGEGGMGFVYKVWDRNLDTDLVVKAPRKAMLDDPEFSSRFALEIRSLVKLSHPHIVKVTDVGEHDGVPFAVMQYLDGGTLDERLDYGRDGKPVPAPPASLASWLPGMAAALDFIHGMGYIHRDVKPSNILFDSHGNPYLSDFGVAKVLSDSEGAKRAPSGMTGVGIVLGTPEYMAPELIMGGQFDGRVDQYALAATAYEILCGRKPFLGETATAILVRQTTEAPPSMDELPSPAARAISQVVLKGLAKKPADRYRTCVEFANALSSSLVKGGVATHRLACPSCGVSFAAPADLANFKGKKSRCQACGVPFRVANDGRSLTRIDPDAMPSPSGSVEIPAASPTPRGNRTVKLDAIPTPSTAPSPSTMKLDAMPAPGPSPARAPSTMKLETMPGGSPGPAPARAQRTMKMAALPAEPAYELTDAPRAAPGAKLGLNPSILDGAALGETAPATRSIPLPWIFGGLGAAALFAIVSAAVTLAPSRRPVTVVKVPPMLTGSPKPVVTAPALSTTAQVQGQPTPAPTGPTGPMALASTKAPPPPAYTPPPQPVTAPVVLPPSQAPVAASLTPLSPPPKVEPPPPAGFDRHEDDAPAPRPAKGTLTLRQLVSSPASYVNEVVTPSDLLLVDTLSGTGGRELAVRTSSGPYRSFEKPETPFRIVLEEGMDSLIREQLNRSAVVPGYYPALMKMKVEKDPTTPGYRGVVEWMELLYFVDARFLEGGGHLNKALFVLGVAPEAAGVRYTRDPKDWESRLKSSKIIPTVRNKFVQEGRPAGYKDLASKAMHPNTITAPFFHEWIKTRIH